MKFINLKKLKNYFKKDTNVLRDWKLVLGGFALLLIIVFLIDVYTFWKYQKELSQQAEIGEVKFVTINRASLQKVIDELNIKERKFNENLTAPEINDPSL